MWDADAFGEEDLFLELGLLDFSEMFHEVIQSEGTFVELWLQLGGAIFSGFDTGEQIYNLFGQFISRPYQIRQAFWRLVVFVGGKEVVHFDVFPSQEILLRLNWVSVNIKSLNSVESFDVLGFNFF